ncbi:hypothetical protein ACQJBY_040268 [Aegilops geniculata]
MHPTMSPAVFGLLLLITLHLPTLPQCYAATDTLSPSQELAGRDKLVSSNGRFALGFFQTGSNFSDGTPKWYLGIWFHTVPKFTPVWVANAENPIANLTTSRLVLSRDGNLAVHHQATTVWSTKANTTTNTTVAALLDNGNLVLCSSSGASNSSDVFWESYDHPTDTVLQGGKIGWNNSTGLIRRLVSRKNVVDQTPGMYSYELFGHNGDTSIVSTFNSSKQYWSSGEWGGQYFSNIPESVGQKWLSLQFTSNKEEQCVQYAIEDPTVLSRGIMDVSGQMKVLLWFEGSSQDWQAVYTAPKSQCDVHATCGPFTVCNDIPFPSCSCMKGYFIRSQQDWELGDRSAGCARNTPLYCNNNSSGVGSETDKFYPMTSVQLPADARSVATATTADECSLACLGSCSCTAYSNDQGACTIWHDKLLNVRQQGNSVLQLRLAAKEVQSSKTNRRGLIIGVAVGASTAALGLIFLLMIWMRKKKQYGDDTQGGMGIIAF